MFKGINRQKDIRESLLNSFKNAENENEMNKTITHLIIQLFIKDFQPFLLVEDQVFLEFVRFLAPKYKLPSRKWFSDKLLVEMYDKIIQQIKEELQLSSKISITTDLWTAPKGNSILSVTCNFLSGNHNRITLFLATKLLTSPHTSENLSGVITEILNDYNIYDKTEF